MDLVTCEAPLDNSFQKDRRELVNKGSLGRRRKPSRSNLRLILSPANDQQDIDLFHRHQHIDSDGSFVQLKASPGYAKECALDNQRKTEANGLLVKSTNNNHRHNQSETAFNVVCNSYREVVASINQIYSLKSVDCNGNNRQLGLKSNNHQSNNTASYIDRVEVIKNKQQKLENGIVNSIHHSELSAAKNQKNVNDNQQLNGKLCNGSYDIISNGYHKNDSLKSNTESQNGSQVLKIRNQQNSVAAKNHLNVITFSNHRQIITSSPVEVKKPAITNGKYIITSPGNSTPKLCKESSLPRTTSKEPNLVAEAQQFSIEAKLKRKKSEVQGRSAVLIQTWERRTQSESYSKLRKDSKSAPKNRFSGKDISDAMPDSYICIKYKGSLQNGDTLQKDELVPHVRDVNSDETMLYRIPDERCRRIQEPSGTGNGAVTINGNSPIQEPEWISLSRKLCAKFVEGHIEPSNSPDSYPYEEPEGVEEEPPSSSQPKIHSGSTQQAQAEVPKKKVVPALLCEDTPSSSEPPWIHLSRKLCNKFIEEHIEYPPITNGHFVEIPDLVEPNGDVRIIEKVGKPKEYKSKQKKECEPEWVSLSKKLRAKFIESHIDDPDTIALDNQLNASDPEETSSDTLSDVSQDMTVPKERSEPLEPVECKNFVVRSQVINRNTNIKKHEDIPSSNDVIFADQECSWEYQEMEFDQESNSGNFQDPESYNEPVQEARIHRGSLPEDTSEQFAERVTFPVNEISRSFQNTECYNNDVKFVPYFNTETARDTNQQNKLITVQFIAHSQKDHQNEREKDDYIPYYSKNSKSASFFNLSTWEEAHCKDLDDPSVIAEANLNKNALSRSLDNLCDSLEVKIMPHSDNFENNQGRSSLHITQDVEKNNQNQFITEDSSRKKENGLLSHVMNHDFENFSDASSMKESAYCVSNDIVNEIDNRMLDCNGFDRQDNGQNTIHNQRQESSSDDEVFECTSVNMEQPSNFSETHYGKISTKTSPVLKNDKKNPHILVSTGKVNNGHCNTNGKNIKCNGMIPNSIYSGFLENESSSSKKNQATNTTSQTPKEPVKLGMSKWITMSKSEQNVNKTEYTNLKPTAQKESKIKTKALGSESGIKNKAKKNNYENKDHTENTTASRINISRRVESPKYENGHADFDRADENSNGFDRFSKEYDSKSKCKSLCDISYNGNSFLNENGFKHHESAADLCSARPTSKLPPIEFQHFEFDSEIPLCAKLVSNHDKKMQSRSANSVQPINRAESPCPSDSSHVYEDMFKETPSGPSDSEASSWVMKNNTYYINGRSSSMNDLDFSDSCSLSVKCDYASSSDNSTLQSRHSSYASSSFYVNLRDYDSHMLEPTLNTGKKTNGKMINNGIPSSVSKSNPPTPESLRHLFTSPLSSIHSPPNRAPRLLNRMPSDPQSHYYSTAAATSSAFKHGFALSPPKPKKAERSSSLKIKDIAHGIILTFKKFQNHSKNSSFSSTQQVDVSHLAEMKSNSELGKTSKGKNGKKHNHDKGYWVENGKTDSDSGFLSDVQRAKARRSSSDLTGLKSNSDLFNSDKKKSKGSKKNSNRDKGKKSRSKTSEPRTVPTVSRKVQQMADGTLYLVTTVSGDTSMPGVYSDSPDTSSELSVHKPAKPTGESNC